MGSRDRDSKSLQDKLKVFFNKKGAPPLRAELCVSGDVERELRAESAGPRRARALRDLADQAQHNRLKDGTCERVWQLTRDVLAGAGAGVGAGVSGGVGGEARAAALCWWRAVCESQPERLCAMRTVLFRYVRAAAPGLPLAPAPGAGASTPHDAADAAEDAALHYRLLHALTDAGKNIACFEEEVCPFLLSCVRGGVLAGADELLALLTNVVKFNASALDEHAVAALIQEASVTASESGSACAVGAALSLLEAVASYSLVPGLALRPLLRALCRTAALERHAAPSWRLSRALLGGHAGHAALRELLRAARDPKADAGLRRGAVFYVHQALWGAQRVHALRVSYLAVLPAFAAALEGEAAAAPGLPYEVALALQGLVARGALEPRDLHEPTWDALLAVLRRLLDIARPVEEHEALGARIHAVLSGAEQLLVGGQYLGDPEALETLLESCASERPEAAALALVSRRAARLAACRGDVAGEALALFERHVRREPRRAVRLHALGEVVSLVLRRRGGGGGGGGAGAGPADELVERVGAPALAACAADACPALRAAGARALGELARATCSEACTDLVDLLQRVLDRPFGVYVCDVPVPADAAAEAEGLRAAAAGLRALVPAALLRAPPTHAARALLVLLDHLDQHYKRPALLQHHPDIRIMILELVFALRTNEYNWVGLCYDERGAWVHGAAAARLRPLCSPLLLLEGVSARGRPPPPPPAPALAPGPPGPGAPGPAASGPGPACVLPAGRLSRALGTALARETDWAVLRRVLRALPELLHAHAPALGRRAPDMDLLASTLCAMLCDRSLQYPECLRCAGGGKVPVSELHAAALPALAAFAPYPAYLEPQTQLRIVRCLLRFGMALRQPQPYLAALSALSLEMREAMVRMLPEVLLDLSKVSDTQLIAAPMLEFLSTLTRLPHVFASFVEDQYMSVFAIVLPYTNPSRYNHYAVSLAHHVIAAWFLKCRLSYRRNFVRFIIHGLHNYILMPFEEQHALVSRAPQPAPVPAANEDSSQRQRSSSLGSRRAAPHAPGAGRGKAGAGAGNASAAFHVELTEACVDLLARYAHTPCSVKPHRSDTASFLFAGGPSATWLVGHRLVTVTTSGCAHHALKAGPCERCALLCRQHADILNTPLPPIAHNTQHAPGGEECAAPPAGAGLQAAPAEEVTRYSKHSLQHSRSTETSCSSLSMSELQPPALATPALATAGSSGHSTRQNSAETRPEQAAGAGGGGAVSAGAPEAGATLAQRVERLAREMESGDGCWSVVGESVGGGACPCWCAQWAEVHVRAPAGDVAWAMRMQNQMNWDQVSESPLQEVAALLAAPLQHGARHTLNTHNRTEQAGAGAGVGAGAGAECVLRARSGSASAHTRPQPHEQLLHKSSSDSVVPPPAAPPTAAHAATHNTALRSMTQPINIPGSPQRQSSSSTTDDDELLRPEHTGKARHPVRRSNSSPEMSSSWKPQPALALALAAAPAPALAPEAEAQCAAAEAEGALDPAAMIVLPVCEPASSSMCVLRDAKKAAKKSDMRVSCEAIPEEMSGTSPHATQHAATQHDTQHKHQHHLMTYNSDPGSTGEAAAAPAAPAAHHRLQKTASDGTVPAAAAPPPPQAALAAPALAAPTAAAPPAPAGPAPDELPPLARSKRSNTISVMSPTRRARDVSRASAGGVGGGGGMSGAAGAALGGSTGSVGSGSSGGASGGGGGVTPAFVFLQLYHNMSTYPISPPVPGEAPAMLDPLAERPLRVSGAQHERTIKHLDHVPPVDTFKVGVLYVGPGQHDNEVAILRNEYGSVRYEEFVSGLGALVSLEAGAPPAPGLFLNLETDGRDGRYAYVWSDDVMQVVFHVATAMPTTQDDPACNEKRKHIGNDFVSIVYNDSGQDFNILTIKGQFNLCVVVVEPCARGTHRVQLKTKDERVAGTFLPHATGPAAQQLVSDAAAAPLARQLALHASLASQISQSLKMGGAPYASNSLERLRLIKRLRRRAEAERLAAAARAPAPYAGAGAPDIAHRVAIDDFNDYT